MTQWSRRLHHHSPVQIKHDPQRAAKHELGGRVARQVDLAKTRRAAGGAAVQFYGHEDELKAAAPQFGINPARPNGLSHMLHGDAAFSRL